MGSVGNDTSRNNEVADNRSVGVIYRDEHLGMKNAVNQQFREGNISKEQRDNAIEKMNAGIQTILERMTNSFEENTVKALKSTMDRQFALTSGSDITGNVELYKTANGFVLEAPATRSNFRVFMDNEGVIRRMPANEMKTATNVGLSGKHTDYLRQKFEDIYNERR